LTDFITERPFGVTEMSTLPDEIKNLCLEFEKLGAYC